MFDGETVGRIEALSASGATHALLDTIDLSTAASEFAVAVLASYRRCSAAASAREIEALARLDELSEPGADDWTREEAAAAMRVAPGTAGSWMGVSRTTLDRLSAALKLLAAGELTRMHLRVLADAVDHLDPATTALVEEYALRRPDLPVGQFRNRVERAVATFDPAGVEEQKENAARDRAVWHKPDPGETGVLVLRGPAEQTTTVFTVMDSLAHQQNPGDDRTPRPTTVRRVHRPGPG